MKFYNYFLEETLIKEIRTENEFNNEILNGKKIIDFWAPWCAPCKRLKETLELISNEVNFDILTVDVDTLANLASSFSVRSLPTLLITEDGNVIKTIIGFLPKDTLISEINSGS